MTSAGMKRQMIVGLLAFLTGTVPLGLMAQDGVAPAAEASKA